MANIMNIDVIEKDCNALNILFQTIINDMKNSPPIWEDFICKTTKLHTQLKSTICASTAFLESFQKIADLATNTKGITKDIGASLTRLCIRHKAIEAKFKQLTCSLNESLVQPLNDKLEEWKKTIINLDKEHNKEYKKVRGELKKKATDTMRLHKKLTKKQPQSGSSQSDQQSTTTTTTSTTYYVKSSDLQYKYDTCLQETHNYYALLEETEKQHLRYAMIEQRNHFCTFFKLLKPIIDIEISMLNEANNMEEIITNLCKHTNDTTLQPNNSNSSTQIFQLEQTIKDLKGSPDFLSTITQNNSNTLNLNLNTNSPPSSPSSLGSRKSSVCSINSLTSSSSSSSHSRSPGHLKFRMQQQLICGGINRLSSVSSQDSGFTSQEQFYLKSPHLLDDKDSNEYKIAMACGTIKAWSKNAIANGANGVNGVINGTNGSNSSLTQTTNQQITTVQQTGASTIVDCSLLARHTVAGLPMPLNNDSQQSLKTRPALSIHTFDPPDHPATTTTITNGHFTTNGHHDLQQQQSPSVSSPVIRSNSVRIDPTNHQSQQQQHYESPSKLTTTNHQLSSPCNNANNTNRNNQIPITTTTTTTILNNNNNNQHHQIMNNCNQNNKNRQRSTTLPPEAIAEGMKELMKTNKNINMNPSPSKQLYNTTNSTLSTLSGTGSSDTLLEEDASFECFSNNNSHQLHDNRHRYSVDRITIPSTNTNNNFVYNEFNLSTTTTTTTATSLSSPSSSSTHSSTNSYNSLAFSSSNYSNSSIPVKTSKPQPPIRRNSSISSNSAAISQKNFIISQQQQHQIQLQYQQQRQENNYDDLHHIQKYNKLLNEQKQQHQLQQQQQQLATIPPSPPPPPPPPLPINGFSNTTNIQITQNEQISNSYEDLPPPPDSFYSDDTPYNHNNGYIIKQESTTVIKQQHQHQQQQQQSQKKPQNNQVSVHQVLMSQIQFGVKLKPTNRPK